MAKRSFSIAPYHREATEQERRFVAEYLYDLDPTNAALRAGYERSVAMNARAMLEEPQIASIVQQEMLARSLRTHVTHDRVVKELACIALVDPLECFEQGQDAEGNATLSVKPMEQIPEDTRRAIEAIEVTANGGVRIKFASKMDALKTLIPHVEVTGVKGRGKARGDQERMKLLMDLAMKAQERAKRLPHHMRASTTDTHGNVTTIEIDTGGDDEQDVTP